MSKRCLRWVILQDPSGSIFFSPCLKKSTAELSKDYVRTSLNEFEDDPIASQSFINEIRTTQPNSPLARAYQAFDEGRFTDIPSLCSQELESFDTSPYRLPTLLLRGSFYLLMGNYAEAISDFDTVINDPAATEKVLAMHSNDGFNFVLLQMKINGELKRANAKIHQRDLEGALSEYDQCVANHPDSCSPHVHRGMVRSSYTSVHCLCSLCSWKLYWKAIRRRTMISKLLCKSPRRIFVLSIRNWSTMPRSAPKKIAPTASNKL